MLSFHNSINVTIPDVSRFTSFICAGGPFGTVIAMPASTYLCEYQGWESVFYVFGALGCLWFIVWALVIHDGPDVHPRISENEKMFLMVREEITGGRGGSKSRVNFCFDFHQFLLFFIDIFRL